MKMGEIALSFIISYLAGNVPTIKNWLESNKTLYDRLNDCYKKAVSQWSVPEETRKIACEQMERHLLSLKDYIAHKPVGRHPKENELLKLWADCILSDPDCCQFIEMHQHEILSLKLDDNLLTTKEILEDIEASLKELTSIKESITKLAQRGLQTCSQFWDNWATGRNIVLDYDIILSGRSDCKKRVWDSCDSPNLLYIEAVSSKEAMAFAVASIITSGERNASRTVIVSKTEILKEIFEETDNLIIITDNLENIHRAILKGHTVICCVCPTANIHSVDLINLPMINRDGFISSLEKSGIDLATATQLAIDTVRDINVLRHLLHIETSNPIWFTASNIQILIPALLIGEWNEECENDRELVATFTRMKYLDYVNELTPLLLEDEAPMIKIGSIWKVKSPYDLMTRIVNYIHPVHLEPFAEIIDWLTEDDDPDAQQKMDSEEFKWWQNKQAFSGNIKQGVYQGLTLLSIIQGRFCKNTEWVDNLITAKLKEFDISRYLSNRHNLRWLAEASPSSFLNYIHSDIKAGASLLNKIFEVKHKQFSIAGSEIYYTELLFCLESLAWDLKYLFTVTDILLFLCKYPNDSNYANRPNESLIRIYRLQLPQTYASFNERLSILRLMGEKYPKEVYKLSFKLLKNISLEIFTRTYHFHWRLRENVNSPKYIEAIPYVHVNELTEFALSLCSFDEQSICDLLELSSNRFMDCARNLIFHAINTHVESIKDNEKVTDKLRKDINHHLSCPKARWALSKKELEPYLELLAIIEPQDILKRNKHFFDKMLITEPYLNELERDFKKKMEKSLNIQASVLNSIIQEKGIDSVWELASISECPDCVANAFIELSNDQHRIIVYQKYIKGELELKFVCRYFLTLYYKNGKDKYMSYIDEFEKINKEKQAIILYAPNLQMELADKAASISSQVEYEYWCNVTVYEYNKCDIKKIIINLIKVDRNTYVLNILNNKDILELLTTKEKIEIITNMLHGESIKALIHNAYQVSEILKTIELPIETNERNLLLQLEFIMYDHLSGYLNKGEFHFIRILNEEPELMMQLIQMGYLPDVDTDEEFPIDENEKQQRMLYAHLAYNFFSHYHDVPCTKEDGSIDESALWSYIFQLQQLAIIYHRVRVTPHIIGQILGNIPETDDYPTNGLCEMVESLNDDTVDIEISCALSNRRGATSRAYNEGGEIERKHIETFRKYKDQTILRSPRLAKIFEEKMREYEKMADWEDERAKLLDIKN